MSLAKKGKSFSLPDIMKDLEKNINEFKKDLEKAYKEIEKLNSSSNLVKEFPVKASAIEIFELVINAIEGINKNKSTFESIRNSIKKLLEYLEDRVIEDFISLISDILSI